LKSLLAIFSNWRNKRRRQNYPYSAAEQAISVNSDGNLELSPQGTQTGVSEINCSEARKATAGAGLVQSGL
jgi:hypothetical protein